MENYQKEISEKVKNFCKKVPEFKNYRDILEVNLIDGPNDTTYDTLYWSHHKTPIFGDKSFTVRINPYVLQNQDMRIKKSQNTMTYLGSPQRNYNLFCI